MRRALPLACVAAVAAGLALAGWGADVSAGIEHATVDARFDIRGEREPSPEVAVVGVDDATLERLNKRWPFPRRDQARLVNRLAAAEPRLIVYDIQITEASGSLAGDLALYNAISRARPVVLATTEIFEDGRTRVFGGAENVRDAGAVVGSGLLPLDHGDRSRMMEDDTEGLPTLTARAAAELSRPLERGDTPFWIDYPGPEGTVPTYPWWQVAEGTVPSTALRDKVVVVGVTAPVLQDRHSTSGPGSGELPGPEIHANAIATALAGIPLAEAPGWVDVLLIVALAIAVPLLALRLRLTALFAVPVLIAGYLVAAQLAFGEGTILPLTWPLAGLVMAGVGTTGVLVFTDVLERRRLRAMFRRFVPEQVADQLITSADDSPQLPGTELDATVLFADLRGFTGFSERHGAAMVIELLNRYLEEMADAVLANGGTVVAYMGDGVMAVFGAPVEQPDHAHRALSAALDMLEVRLARLNAWLTERGLEHEFRLGVGLNSGPVMSGTVGSERRLEYTAVGDTTNVAARLQAMTKEFGEPLLMSQATRDRLGDVPGLTDVGEATVRGRSAQERLWTIRELEEVPV